MSDLPGIRKERNYQEGRVVEALPATTFRVVLANGQEILAHLTGRMKINYIRILTGDRVLLEVSSDGRRGRIVRRL